MSSSDIWRSTEIYQPEVLVPAVDLLAGPDPGGRAVEFAALPRCR